MMNPYATLEPTEWSLVWYVAEAEDWGFVPATASGGGLGNNQIVPGPIPAPGALALLGLAGLFGRRRRS